MLSCGLLASYCSSCRQYLVWDSTEVDWYSQCVCFSSVSGNALIGSALLMSSKDSTVYFRFHFLFNRPVFPKLGPRKSVRWLLQQVFYSPESGCTSCHPTNSIKVLREENTIYSTTRKRGKAQHDGCPLCGSVSPPVECYWLVNASPLNYGRWLGQNSSPIFSHLWTKVHQSMFACVGVSVVSMLFSDWRCLVVLRRYLQSNREVVRNHAEIWCFGAAIFRGEGATQFSDRIL